MNEIESHQRDENFARALMDEGFACLDRHDLNGATEVARKLAQLRHSGTFEIMAEVNLMAGNIDKAVEILEDGVKNAPGVWLLWQSLGNACTQLGKFERAQTAYGRALGCANVDVSSVQFNRGLAYARSREWPQALEALDGVSTAALRYKAASFKLAVQNDMHRFDEARDLGRSLLEEEASDAEDRARVHAQVARAALQGYDDIPTAQRHADIALKIWPHEPTATFVQQAIAKVQARPTAP